MNIRPILPHQAPLARALILAGMVERWGWLDETANPDLTDIWTTYVCAGHRFFVGERAGEIVATGALWFVQERVGRIVRMSVAQQWRGLGFGRKMTDHLIASARHAGCHTLLVETNDSWQSALMLYRTAGFIETHRDGVEVHMQLQL